MNNAALRARLVHLIGLGCWTPNDQVSIRAAKRSFLHLIVVESSGHDGRIPVVPSQHAEQCSWADDGCAEILHLRAEGPVGGHGDDVVIRSFAP